MLCCVAVTVFCCFSALLQPKLARRPPVSRLHWTHVGRHSIPGGHAKLTRTLQRPTCTRAPSAPTQGLCTASSTTEQTPQRHSFRARRHQSTCSGAIAVHRQRICQFGARLCRERWAREETFPYAAGRAGYARRARYEDAVLGTAELEQHHHREREAAVLSCRAALSTPVHQTEEAAQSALARRRIERLEIPGHEWDLDQHTRWKRHTRFYQCHPAWFHGR